MIFLLLLNLDSFSQDAIKNFEIVLPKNKVENSYYNKISFLDSRRGSKEIGMVDVGLLKNAQAKLVLKAPFEDQLMATFASLIDSTARDGELLIQFNRFSFAETYGTRYCYLAASLYAKHNAVYRKIALVDTVMLFRSANSIILIREESKIITSFISENLLREAKDTVDYSFNDLTHIDSIEMQKIPVFTTTNYKEGLYLSYTSFKNQMPDKQAIVDANRDGSISSIKIIDSTGKKVKMHPKNIYAVVYKGQPFIATAYGYYELQKADDNNFLFTGDVKIAASQGDVSGGQLALGLIGAALASAGSEETYTLMIDYRNGTFIHLRKVEKPAE